MERTLFAKSALGALALSLAACASPTAYERASGTDDTGYSSTQLASERYRIMFEGNEATSRETVETYLLYRAAEVADRRGAPFFVVTSRNVDAELDVEAYSNAYTTMPGFYGYGFGAAYPYYTTVPYDYSYNSFADPRVNVDVDDSYEAAAIIELYDRVPQGRENVFETADILRRLGDRIDRPMD